MRVLVASLALLLGQAVLAAEWLDWFGTGAILDVGSAVIVAGDPGGDPAGAWSSDFAGDYSGQQLSIRVMSTDWGAVSLAEVVLSTRGNFEEYLQVDLRPLLSAPPEGEWIDVTVPAGAWNPSAGADWSTVNGLVLRVSSHVGKTGMVGFSGILFMKERASRGAVTIAFDDGRSDVFDYAWPQLRARGLTATVFAIPELIGHDGYMTQQQLYVLHDAGWEIAAHGEHPLNWMTDEELQRHFRFASEWLAASGFGDRQNYAYPNGLYNERVLELIAQRFVTGRTINAQSDVLGYASPYRLGGISVYPELPQEELERLISAAVKGGEWLTIVFHLFKEEPDVPTQFPPSRFESLLDYLVENEVQVLTTRQAWQLNQQLAICGPGHDGGRQLTPEGPSEAGIKCG